MVLFSNGFENGDFTGWTSQTGVPTVQSIIKKSGTYAMRITGSNAGSNDFTQKDLTFNSNPRFLRAYLYFDDLGDNDYTGDLLGIRYYSSNLGGFRLQNTGGHNHLLSILDDTATTYGGTDIQADTWYCMEVEHFYGAGTGYVKIYLNGSLEISNTGLTNANYTPTNVMVGNKEDYKGANIYYDDVVADVTYIGPLPSTTSKVYRTFGDGLTSIINCRKSLDFPLSIKRF